MLFKIGEFTYQWDTQNSTVAFGVVGTQPSTFGSVASLGFVELFYELEAAKDVAKQLQEQSRHPKVITPDNASAASYSGLFTGTGGQITQISSSNWPIKSEVSLFPSAQLLRSPHETTPPGELHRYFFGIHAKKEEIDNWVDRVTRSHQGGIMKCPETECGASLGFSHALRVRVIAFNCYYGVDLVFRCIYIPITTYNVRSDEHTGRSVLTDTGFFIAFKCTRCASSFNSFADLKMHGVKSERTSTFMPANQLMPTPRPPHLHIGLQQSMFCVF